MRDSPDLHRLYQERKSRDWLVDYVRSSEDVFELTVEKAISAPEPEGWRAAWILGHAMERGDVRVQCRIEEFVDAIPGKQPGHQRELLRILLKLEVGEDIEGSLFDTCMSLWEDLQNPPAVRYFAFRHMANTAERYPEIVAELRFVVADDYLDPLSPGIRNGVRKIVRRLGIRP